MYMNYCNGYTWVRLFGDKIKKTFFFTKKTARSTSGLTLTEDAAGGLVAEGSLDSAAAGAGAAVLSSAADDSDSGAVTGTVCKKVKHMSTHYMYQVEQSWYVTTCIHLMTLFAHLCVDQ